MIISKLYENHLLSNRKKKTDEKQDKVIEQLQKNQKALISGIQDIMTLNRELPQITPEEMQELPAPKEENVFIANIEKRFYEKDNEIIDELGLIKPSELLKSDPSHLIKYQEVKKMEKYNTCYNWFKKYKEKRCQPRIKRKRKREKNN